MTRKECLEQAMGCVLRDRQKQYGEPEDCFETIAMMWSAYLGKIIQGWDVAAMMALLKIARIKANPAHADNWCDLAGYAACGAECRQKFEAEMKKTVEDAFETFPHLKPEAEGGCWQNGNDQPEEPEFKPGDAVEWNSIASDRLPAVYQREFGDFGHCVVRLPDGRERIVRKVDLRKAGGNHPENPDSSTEAKPKFKRGDKVQYRVVLPSVSDSLWRDATYLRPAFSWQQDGEHIVSSDLGPVTVKDEDIRPAPKAEGCEALVEHDAPQTKEELLERIRDCNPATYGRARKPTGEELAEMAEEDEKHE